VQVDLRALVDYSSVEAFVMQGRAVINLPVVPSCTEDQWFKDKCSKGQSQAGVSVGSQAGATLSGITIYEMGCMWTANADADGPQRGASYPQLGLHVDR
jgi:hypothetical protein